MAKRPERFLVILESPGKQKKIRDMLGENILSNKFWTYT